VVDFDGFFAAEYEGVVRSLTLVFADRGRAEDAAQVGFERALRRWSSVGSMERPGTWVYVVAVRQGRRDLLRDRAEPPVATDQTILGPEDAVADASWLAAAVDRLPPRQRAAIVLRHLSGLRLADIAEALGVTTGTIKSSLHAAYSTLRIELSDHEEVDRAH
jgi:RNA polymerase sigma factor (sigma-70 family)